MMKRFASATSRGKHAKKAPRSISRSMLAAMLAVALAFVAVCPAALSFATEGGQEAPQQETLVIAGNPTTEDFVKNQVVYVRADAAGAQEGVYVVNSFTADAGAVVSDAGAYVSLKNLTDAQALGGESGKVAFQIGESGAFMYQGDLEANAVTPWIVSVSYELDGVAVPAAEIGGATGELTLTLKVKPNPACEVAYADNYLMQVTGAFNNAMARDIEAEGATVAQAGDDTQFTYLVFPGSEVEYVITAQVTDFAFGGWQLVGVPLAIALDVDYSQFEGATEELGTLTDAIARVNDGASKIQSGSNKLEDGIATLSSASSELNDGAAAFKNALDEAQNGANTLSSGVNDGLISGAEALSAGSSLYVDTMTAQAANLQAQADEATAASGEALQTLMSEESSYLDKAVALETIISGYSYQAAADALNGAIDGYGELDAGIQSMVDSESSSSVYALADGAEQLASGMGELGAGFDTLQEGISAYTGGVDTLADNYETYAAGVNQLANGTQELANKTQDLDQQLIDGVREQLEEFLNPEFTAPDYVNGETDTDQVQFIYMTGAVDVPAEEAPAQDADAEVEEEKGFFAKLLALFGIEL